MKGRTKRAMLRMLMSQPRARVSRKCANAPVTSPKVSPFVSTCLTIASCGPMAQRYRATRCPIFSAIWCRRAVLMQIKRRLANDATR
ncbi:hypothetical protein BOTU111922_10380 [Bordetella tumulicola]